MKELYFKRARQFFFATLGFVSLAFFGCLPLYPYFKLPLHPNLVLGMLAFNLLLGVIFIPLALFLRKRLFPIKVEESYWSQRATTRYFWLYFLVGIPFAFSFFAFIVFASLALLIEGYLLTVSGLILLRPREEDLI
jgi:hypothetical protein